VNGAAMGLFSRACPDSSMLMSRTEVEGRHEALAYCAPSELKAQEQGIIPNFVGFLRSHVVSGIGLSGPAYSRILKVGDDQAKHIVPFLKSGNRLSGRR